MALSSVVIWPEPDLGATMKRLAAYNQERLRPTAFDDVHSEADRDAAIHVAERVFIEAARRDVRLRAEVAPATPNAFVEWFRALENNGPGQNDPLFTWLEHEATLDEMRWFLRQEISGEAGFEDLVAMTQVKMPSRVKLELARNYWDEMGQGHAGGMHGPMLTRLAEELGMVRADAGLQHWDVTPVVWEAQALANLMVALAVRRRYAFHAIGALGVIELTAPGRARCVNAGLQRLNVRGEARRYFALHATLDVKHAEAWCSEVLAPLVAEDGRLAQPIAEGALMRLCAGQRTFERYRRELGVPASA